MKGSRQLTADSSQLRSKTSGAQHFPAWVPPLILFLAVLTLFGSFLSPSTHQVLSKWGEDMTADYTGWRQFGFGELRKGHLALWNPHLFGGAPFFGDFQSALLYPPNWVFLIAPLPFALNFSLALHILLAGLFTWAWLSNRGSHPLSALTGAFMFAFGGASFLHVVPGHLPNLCAMSWIPLVFLAVDGWRERSGVRWILLGALAFAMQVLSGHIQYSYYTVLAVVPYVLFNAPQGGRPRGLLGLFGMGLGAGALTAVQLLAGWDAAWESLRGQRLPIDIVDIADMTPERLWCLLMPDFFGGWKDYWGGGFYWEGAVFVSLTGFVLALYAFKVAQHPQRKFFGWMSLFLIVLAVGKRTPLFVLFYHFFPLFGSFRGVGKLNIFITLFLAALAAMAMDVLLKDPKKLQGLAKGAAWGGGVILLLAGSFFLAPKLGGGGLFGKFGGHAAGMTGSLFLCGVLLGLLALLSHFAPKKPVLRYGLGVLACLELFAFAWGNRPSFDFRDLEAKMSVIEKVHQDDPGEYRVLLGDLLTLSTSAQDIWGEDPVIPARYASFLGEALHCDANTAFLQKFTFLEYPPALGLLRLRYVFKEEGKGLSVQRLKLREAPRAFLADRWEIAEKEGIFKKAAAPSFDTVKGVLLEEDPGIQMNAGKAGKLEVKDLSTDVIEVKAETSKPSLFVMTDNYSRGWKVSPYAYESEQQVYRVLPANGFQRAVPLEAGSHHFLLEYKPVGFTAGKCISIIAWLVFFSLWIVVLVYMLSGKESSGLSFKL